MRKYFLLLLTILFFTKNVTAQTKGVKIGYIDMEYILEKVPDYAEAKNQLEQKAQKWKQEIEQKKVEIAKQKETLKSERVLLTKELLEERESEINFLETELLEFQQKKFGPNGDLMTQKSVLVKPIQDQVFNIVQDISEAKKYDFVFDRSSDLTMLFAAKRFDISDQVVIRLTRAEKRQQMTKKQLAKEEEAERKQDLISENPTLSERQKILDEKKLAREKLAEEKKLAFEERKALAEEKRKKLLQDREDKKNGTVSDKTKSEPGANKTDIDSAKEDKKIAAEESKAKIAEAKAKTLEDRKKVLEERKKAAEEKRLKTLADREAAKKAKEEERKAKEEERKNKETENTKP